LIIGYRGLIDLARRSGQISRIEAHPAYEKDRFKIQFGLNPILEHEPDLSGDPGPMILVYAVAELRDGTKQVEVMTKKQVDGIRARSKAGKSGPWVTDYDEMAKKTVVRRLCKYLPLSVELVTAFERDDELETLEARADVIPELTAGRHKSSPKPKAVETTAEEEAQEPLVVPPSVSDDEPDDPGGDMLADDPQVRAAFFERMRSVCKNAKVSIKPEAWKELEAMAPDWDKIESRVMDAIDREKE
jgi:recombination protein RecT